MLFIWCIARTCIFVLLSYITFIIWPGLRFFWGNISWKSQTIFRSLQSPSPFSSRRHPPWSTWAHLKRYLSRYALSHPVIQHCAQFNYSARPFKFFWFRVVSIQPKKACKICPDFAVFSVFLFFSIKIRFFLVLPFRIDMNLKNYFFIFTKEKSFLVFPFRIDMNLNNHFFIFTKDKYSFIQNSISLRI